MPVFLTHPACPSSLSMRRRRTFSCFLSMLHARLLSPSCLSMIRRTFSYCMSLLHVQSACLLRISL
jgi:hypothetical protein